jgi:predicted ArsR family transcriptional regulator
MREERDLVPIDEARTAVQNMARRVALLHMSYARVLVDELGEEMGKQLVRQAIWEYGSRIGQRMRAAVEEQGLDPTIENMDRGSDLSPLGFESATAVVDGEARSRSVACPMAEVWREYGEDELGTLYCEVDPAKTQAYSPAWTQVHTRKLPDGDDYCEMAIRPRSAASLR